MFTVQQMAPL